MSVELKDIIIKNILKELDNLTRISVDIELMLDDESSEGAKQYIIERIAQVKDKTEMLGTYSDLFLRS